MREREDRRHVYNEARRIDADARLAAIADAWKENPCREEVAKRFNMKRESLSVALSQARQQGLLPRVLVARNTASIVVSVYKGLAHDAAKRGISIDLLINRLLKTIVQDDLVDAVLDDQKGREH
jgi:hypothetical protein